MQKFLFTVILAFTMSSGFAGNVKDTVLEQSIPSTTQQELKSDTWVADLIGISKNQLSDELMFQLVWSGIPNRPHFIFHTLQQCQSIPECVCEPYNGQWGCFIR